MKKRKILFFIVFYFTTIFMTGCQISKYDTFDAEKYVKNNLDIEVISVFCTGELGFDGSQKYDLVANEKEICFILGEDQDVEYVYSFGARKNTKLIQNEPSITSSIMIDHLIELQIDIKYWKYIYLEEIDSLAYQITTLKDMEIFLFSENGDYKYYVYSPDDGLVNITEQDLIDLVNND